MTERTVGELLRHHRLAASLKQAELAGMLGYDTSHISRVERNQRLPTTEYIQQFIQSLHLEAPEQAELMHLFEISSELDTVSQHGPLKRMHRQDWGEAPDVSVFYGRQQEMALLQQWLVAEGCRAIAVLGMGGMGKTTLVTKAALDAQEAFDYIIWRSLRNAPPMTDILSECLQFLGDQPSDELPGDVNKSINLLIDHLRQHRCLLILDNVESILQDEQHAGHTLDDYEAYGHLIRRVGESHHQSCLILTSREKPPEFAALEGQTTPVRSFQLSGLSHQDGREILKDKGLSGSDENWAALNHRYSGNPLALKLVSETIREIFSGDITGFLREPTFIFGGVRDILSQQFESLSPLAQGIMVWLAIAREPVPLEELRSDIIHPGSNAEFLEALNSLRRRSLIEQSALGLTLQNVVMEYLTVRLIDRIYDEIMGETWSFLQSHALIKAQAQDYVRESQLRLILNPLVERLLAALGQEGLESRLSRILMKLREATDRQKPGYAGGNVLNLLIHLQTDLNKYDFKDLTIWQAYLRDVSLADTNFTQANLARTMFTDTFGSIFCVTFSPDGKQLAVGTADSEIRLWHVADGKQLLICRGHTSWVRSVAVSPDGQTVASGSSDHTIRLWDVETGACLRVLEGHSDRVRSLAFTPPRRSAHQWQR